MASRFVSGGQIDAASGEVVKQGAAESGGPQGDGGPARSAQPASGMTASSGRKQEEWEAVQREMDAERRRREEQRAKMMAGEERSLYDILQANKAAKQAAFEEQNKIKNQFRPLDDDEIEFLDGVRESTQREEARLRQETDDGVRHFRAAQREREREERNAEAREREEDRELEAETEDWSAVGRKRKRKDGEGGAAGGKGRFVKGLKRRTSSGDAAAVWDDVAGRITEKVEVRGDTGRKTSSGVADKGEESEDWRAGGAEKTGPRPAMHRDGESKKSPDGTTSAPASSKPKMGLVSYGSDDDSD